MADKQTNVSTIVRDDFFNDPFFKDWWADFDMPFKTVQFNRQISGEDRYLRPAEMEIMSVSDRYQNCVISPDRNFPTSSNDLSTQCTNTNL